MSFDTVDNLEKALADYWNAPFCVTTDCCTHAIELCLRWYFSEIEIRPITIPQHTYISVPFTLEKLHLPWYFQYIGWHDYYELGDTGIIDAAVHWKPGGYIPGKMMCLSFQFKKPLNLGRGGAILLDDPIIYQKMRRWVYDGRERDIPWTEQLIENYGFHYYMTPETAQTGLDKLSGVTKTRDWSWQDYPDLTKMPVFKPDDTEGLSVIRSGDEPPGWGPGLLNRD